MFSKNHIVSVRQMKRLLVLDLFAGTGLVLPAVICRLSGTSGIFALVAGGIGAQLFALFLLNMGNSGEVSYPAFCEEIVGGIGAKIVMAVYAIRYFITAALMLGVFAQIINHTFLSDIPKAVLGIAMLLLCIYCVFKGLETRARLGEMLVYIVIVPIVFIIILAIPQIHLQRLVPVTFLSENAMGKPTPGAGGVGGFLWGSVVTFAMLSPIEWLLFLRPGVKKREKVCQSVMMSIVWPVLLNILLLVVCIGIFSVKGMNNESWPAVTLMQIVRFPGGFLSRQDGLMLAFWMAGMFMLVGGNIYYGLLSFKSIHKSLCKPWIIVFPALFVLACFLGIYLQDAARLLITYMTWISMPLAVVIPVGIRLIDSLRKSNKAPTAHGRFGKLPILLAVLLSGSFFMSGCGGLVEIEDRNYVMCLGIDMDGDALSVSFGFPDLKALTGDGDNIHYPAVTLLGRDMEAVEAAYRARSNKRLDYGQLQMIVFGRTMMKNEHRMRQVLEYIQENQAFTRTVLVCMADETAKEIVSLDEDVNGSIGVYLRQMFDNNSDDYRMTVGDLIIGLSLTDEESHMAVVARGDQVPVTVGWEAVTGFYVKE